MIKINQLTEDENRLIADIAAINLGSLYRLHTKGESADVILLLSQYEDIDINDYHDIKNDRIEKFHKLQDNPYMIADLSSEDLTTFRYILRIIETEYKENYPKTVENLWKKLFFLEEFRFNIIEERKTKMN